MINIKRLLAKFNIYKLRIKKLEGIIKSLWDTIDELGRILKIAAELRQKEEQERLKRESRQPVTITFTMKEENYQKRMKSLETTQRIRDWGYLFTEAFKREKSTYPERRLKKLFGVKE